MGTVGEFNMKMNIPNSLIYIAGGFLLGRKKEQVNCLICRYLEHQAALKKFKESKEFKDERPINIMGDLI